jgi:argininosuccinate lyase
MAREGCPLGAAALAGTGFPIDRSMTARALGFEAPSANSLDAVSSRDFALQALSALALAMTTLSRLAEELVLWSSPQFGFVRLADAWSTGSSIMPQKRNPDAAELIRAKASRVSADLVALLGVMKALPLAYAKDLQEDKSLTFDAFDAFELSIAAAIGMIETATFNRAPMEAAAERGFSTATELADWLVREAGLPFREAHHITGAVVKRAEALGAPRLSDLALAEFQAIEPRITQAAVDALSVRRAVESRASYGGTAPVRVREQVGLWKALLSGAGEEDDA